MPLQGAQPSDSGLALAGLLVVGVTGARGSSDPWWCSPLPVAGFVLGIGLGDHGGGLIMAAAFAGVAYALATRTPTAAAPRGRLRRVGI